ncbi:MAG: hypothetical protein PF904_16815 [Kiritimatiellae bacterium]|nr:hypothetical protein [Kiritimatiellia bacterium]
MNLTLKQLFKFGAVCVSACALSSSATGFFSDSFEAPEGTNGNSIALYKIAVSGTQSENTNFQWFAASGDASAIAITNAAYADIQGDGPITGEVSELILDLETEGNTLSRTVGVSLATSVYVDTLIQFTPSEDDPDLSGSTDIKIALFVNAQSNLVVRHMYVDAVPPVVTHVTNTVIELAEDINPDKWYRLSMELKQFNGVYGTKIYIDGTAITHPFALAEGESSPTLGGSYFFNIVQANSMELISFQGTGALDELVVSDEAPYFSTPAAIMLTLVFNDNLMDVTQDAVTLASNDQVAVGSTISIDAIDWYEIASVTGDGVVYTGPIGSQTNETSGALTMETEAAVDVTIAAQYYTGQIPVDLEGNTVDAGKLAAWAYGQELTQNYVEVNAAALLDDYLLNVDEGTDAELKITKITVDGSLATIEIEPTVGTVDLTPAGLNGTLNVYSKDDLTAAWPTTPAATQDFTIETAGKVTATVDVGDGKFLKAVVE